MEAITARTSTIFIAEGVDQTRVYRSFEDVPVSLRRKLKNSTSGANAFTILIADQRGQEELLRALQGQSDHFQKRLTETLRARRAAPPTPEKKTPAVAGPLKTWLELLLPIAIGASIWFFIESRF